MISCGNILSATDLIRLVIVDENGQPFFDCDNKWNSIRQVTVMGEDGLPALKIGELGSELGELESECRNAADAYVEYVENEGGIIEDYDSLVQYICSIFTND